MSAQRVRSGSALQRREDISGYLFLLPTIALFCVFVFLPFGYSLFISMGERVKGGTLSDMTFVGLKQFETVIHSSEFWNSMLVTCQFTFPVVFFHVGVGLILAVALNMRIPARSALRSAYFTPYVISMVVAAMIWKFMFSANIGLFNVFLSWFGFPRNIGWLTMPQYAMAAMIIVSVWKYVGYHTVIYLAALQDIPRALYEAADISGANAWQKFHYITFPLLSNTTWFLVTISIINTFQAFDQIHLMTSGGPMFKTDVIVHFIYRKAFYTFDMPYASAAAWLLFVVIFILTAIQTKLSRSDWSY